MEIKMIEREIIRWREEEQEERKQVKQKIKSQT